MDQVQGYFGEIQRVVVELKIVRDGLPRTLADGLEQIVDNADECYLVLFDRDPEAGLGAQNLVPGRVLWRPQRRCLGLLTCNLRSRCMTMSQIILPGSRASKTCDAHPEARKNAAAQCPPYFVTAG